MGIKRVEFHDDAARELSAAVEWYFVRSERAAVRFFQDVTQAVEQIAQFPAHYETYVGETRKFVLRQFPFLIIYLETPGAIQILAVAHAKRRPNYWKKRL